MCEREILENQQEITTLTVIWLWARQLDACQPSAEAGAGPVAERARVDFFVCLYWPKEF